MHYNLICGNTYDYVVRAYRTVKKHEIHWCEQRYTERKTSTGTGEKCNGQKSFLYQPEDQLEQR